VCEIGYKWETTFRKVQSLFETRRMWMVNYVNKLAEEEIL